MVVASRCRSGRPSSTSHSTKFEESEITKAATGEAGIALQNAAEERDDVPVYTTSTLDKNLEVTGPVKLVLYVATTALSTDFTAKLVDVLPNGDAYNVCNGILRRRYSDAEEPVEIEIELWLTSYVFLAGN